MVALPTAGRSPARPITKQPRALRRALSYAGPAPGRPATVEEWLAIPEQKRAELIRGRIVYHAFPGVKHGNTQGRLSGLLRPYDRRRPGGGGGDAGVGVAPGGWWISLEVDMVVGEVGCRPDLVGWRRDKHARVPQLDARGVVSVTPDFLCEVLSPSTARYDQGEKRDAYFQAAVPHYWLVDPELQTLTVLEWTPRGYLIIQVAGPGEVVKAAPFEAVEIPVDELFMDEEGELPAEADTKQGETRPVAASPKPPVKQGRASTKVAPKVRAPRNRTR